MTTLPAAPAEIGFRVLPDRSGVIWTIVQENGEEQQMLLPMEDLTQTVAGLLGAVTNAFLREPSVWGDQTPPPEQNVIVLPKAVALNSAEAFPVLVFDFGGVRVNMGVDAESLRRILGLINQVYP